MGDIRVQRWVARKYSRVLPVTQYGRDALLVDIMMTPGSAQNSIAALFSPAFR